jgi:hypothetical protein
MMKAVVIVTILFGAFCVSVRAEDSNPYVSIVARNVFSLVPMPTNNPADDKKPDPPAKITPNGIMTLFGQLQVLFKVATPPKPGEPAQDQSYVMSEGDRQDGIAVTKIDEQAGMITFDNHGVTQKLALTTAADASTSPASDGGPRGNVGMPGMRRFGGRLGQPRNPNSPFGGNNPGSYTPSSGGNSGANNSMSSPTTPSYGGNNGGSYGGNNYSQQANQLSPEAQALLIEQNRINTQDQVDAGAMPPLPPTAITPSGATGKGGAPLVP